MNPQSIVRAMVLAPKQIFLDEDGWLDLTYVTPRVIVAAGPTDNILHGLFRSPIHRIIAHLNETHVENETKHWHVWNLRREHSGYIVEDELQENWSWRPFPDHQPPSLLLLEKVVKEIALFLSQNSKNVALIHCKEGKGRSGTICCAYLMYEAKMRGLSLSDEAAIRIFTQKRMRRLFGPGVSTVCQRRYLHYWGYLLRMPAAVRINYDNFHSLDSVPFKTSSSLITKLKLLGPSAFLACHKIRLYTYVEDENGVNLAEIAEKKISFAQTIDLAGIIEIPIDLPLTPGLNEVKISFEGPFLYAYSWFNLFFETFGKSSQPIGDKLKEGRFVMAWEDFDGFFGLKTGTPGRLFDLAEINWIFNHS